MIGCEVENRSIRRNGLEFESKYELQIRIRQQIYRLVMILLTPLDRYIVVFELVTFILTNSYTVMIKRQFYLKVCIQISLFDENFDENKDAKHIDVKVDCI